MNASPLRLDIRSLKPLEAEFTSWRDALGIEVFIETGTHMGKTARSAADFFPEVHTIELSRELYEGAKRLHADCSNLHFHHGDSPQVLPQILEQIQGRRAMLWLDAHFSGFSAHAGVMTARGSTNCPTVQELDVLREHGVTDAVVLVDDLRQFENPSSQDPRDAIHTGYPEFGVLDRAINRLGDYRLHVVGDIAFAHPASDAVEVSQGLKAMSASRSYDGNPAGFEAILTAEEPLTSLPPFERALLRELVAKFAARSPSGQVFLGGHYLYWEGLALLGEGQLDAAVRAFDMAQAFGMNDGRARVRATHARTRAAMA